MANSKEKSSVYFADEWNAVPTIIGFIVMVSMVIVPFRILYVIFLSTDKYQQNVARNKYIFEEFRT